MNDQRTPNLEMLDEQGARRLIAGLPANPNAERAHGLRHEGYAMEMPQSGERIRGREKIRGFQQAYPNPPGHAATSANHRRKAVGRGGRFRLRRGRLPPGGYCGTAQRKDLAGDPLLRRVVRGARMEGSVGRVDGGSLMLGDLEIRPVLEADGATIRAMARAG